MTTTEVKEEQKVYVRLPPDYDDGKHILSWALSNFPKDETQIIVTSIIPPLSANHSDRRLNQLRKRINKTLDKHLTQCAIQKFKAEKLIHENGDVVEVGILELIDVRAIKNLVMWLYPNSQVSTIVAEKANPSCKIWFIYEGNLLLTRGPKSELTEATSEEVKEEQKVYVCLPSKYDIGKHILSWALNHFPKDETNIIATSFIPTLAPNHPRYNALILNEWRETCNKFLDIYVAQCAIHQFKAVKLTHDYCHNQESLELTIAEAILELIDLRAIKNLIMWSAPNSQISTIVAEKANPSCKIWFIHEGNLLLTRYPKSDLSEATSEEKIRRVKLHLKEIEEIRNRENDKNDLLKRENEQLKLENQLLKNQQNDNVIQLKNLDKEKQQLEKRISDLDIDYKKLKQERDNAIKEEMEQTTQNFSDSLKIGEGGFGCVYKGSLHKTTVVIKKLNSESLQGLSEFQQEDKVKRCMVELNERMRDAEREEGEGSSIQHVKNKVEPEPDLPQNVNDQIAWLVTHVGALTTKVDKIRCKVKKVTQISIKNRSTLKTLEYNQDVFREALMDRHVNKALDSDYSVDSEDDMGNDGAGSSATVEAVTGGNLVHEDVIPSDAEDNEDGPIEE